MFHNGICFTIPFVSVMAKRLIDVGTRKLSKQNYSWVLTIPDVWVKNSGIKQNEAVVFLMDDKNNLIIKPHKVYENEKV